MACTRKDVGMTLFSKWGLQPRNSAMRNFVAKYLSFLAGDLASPHICGWVRCW